MGGNPGFMKYEAENLPKVNSLRKASSLVNVMSTPIPDKGEVLFSPAASAHDEPRSCSNCWMYNSKAGTCRLMGPSVRAQKFTYPPAPDKDGAKPIEYWPVCGMWDYGDPNEGVAIYKNASPDSPDDIGFGFVNAPSVGLERSGTCCSGAGGGDDCDSYMVSGADKRAARTGFCRVLQTTVGGMDCCAQWADDDFIGWQAGQKLLESLDERSERGRSPNPLLR